MATARRPRRHLRRRVGLAALIVMVALAALLMIVTLEGCAASGSGRAGLAPTINNAAVLDSILQPVFADRDFQPLFDRLADDVVLEVTVSGDMRLGRELRGKRNVMAFLLNEDAVAGFAQRRPPEYLGSGNRVVIRGAGGAEARVEFREGRITRLVVIRS